jgi:hypothetical protein
MFYSLAFLRLLHAEPGQQSFFFPSEEMNSISNELPAQIVGNQNTDTRRDTPGLDRLPQRFHDPCIAVSMCHIITISRRMNNGKTTEIQHEEVHILR